MKNLCFVIAKPAWAANLRGVAGLLGVLLPLALCPAVASPIQTSAGPDADRIPILYAQAGAPPIKQGLIRDRTLAIFPISPHRQTIVRPDMGTAFWSGDHRRVFAFGRPIHPTVRLYDAAQGRFGPPADAVSVLADPGVHYALPLSDLAQTNAIDWSRDGHTLCYSRDKTGLVLFDLRRGTHRLLQNPSLARHPVSALALSPDGSRIAFSVEGADEFHADFFQDLWLIGIDGRGLHKLGHGASPNWSPQGRFLVATEGTDQDGRAILRYDTQTGVRRILRAIPQTPAGDGYFGPARYNPDGRQIAVFGPPDPRAPEDTALFLIDGQGRLLRTLATQRQLGESGIPSLAW